MRLLNDDKFCFLKDTLDAMMKESASDGLGLTKKQGEVITLDEEEQLWSKGVLGDSSPQQLLDTIVYLFGIHLAFRGGSEHRRLRSENSQIVKGKDKRTGLEYREDISKTNAGGLKDRKIQEKITRAYDNIADKRRCIVRLYEKYLKTRSKRCSAISEVSDRLRNQNLLRSLHIKQRPPNNDRTSKTFVLI